MDARDRGRPAPSDAAAEAEAIETVLGRLERLANDLRAIDSEVERLLGAPGGAARPNPRRAHHLLITAVNAVAEAERRLRRRLALDLEEAGRASSGRGGED